VVTQIYRLARLSCHSSCKLPVLHRGIFIYVIVGLGELMGGVVMHQVSM